MSQNTTFIEHELTGSRLIVPIINILGHFGPKHHGLVIGVSDHDEKLYVSEFSRRRGACLLTIDQFMEIYSGGGEIKIQANDSSRSNTEVAQAALNEIAKGNNNNYHLVLNNCENSVDRAMYGKSSLSSQVINTLLGLGFALIGGAYIYKKKQKSRS